MIIGTIDLKMSSGFRTPMLAIPTPDLAVPYEAPRSVYKLSQGVLTGEDKS